MDGSRILLGSWVAGVLALIGCGASTVTARAPDELREYGDLDGDGVPDLHDRCPRTPGVRPGGCAQGADHVAAGAAAGAQCEYSGRQYPSGAPVQLGCSTCTCVDGELECTRDQCPKISEWFITFDAGATSTTGRSAEALDRIAEVLRVRRDYTVVLAGGARADETSNPDALGLARARWVHGELLGRGALVDAFTGVEAREPRGPNSQPIPEASVTVELRWRDESFVRGATAPVTQAPPSDTRIVAWQSLCIGKCPAYSIVVDARGEVEFRGIDHVAALGERRASIDPAQVSLLLKKANDAEFFGLDPLLLSALCTQPPHSHGPNRGLEITANGATHVVSGEGRCRNIREPQGLDVVMGALEEFATGQSWLGAARISRTPVFIFKEGSTEFARPDKALTKLKETVAATRGDAALSFKLEGLARRSERRTNKQSRALALDRARVLRDMLVREGIGRDRIALSTEVFDSISWRAQTVNVFIDTNPPERRPR